MFEAILYICSAFEGERNTSFILGFEKKHQTNNTLLEIKNDNNIFTSNGEILHEIC